ncbi:MAG: hypothetical protein LBK58_00685 [Prevotellaceae bacterium]|nr:hypothetical protein [Prevotellaceae bacterium]
MLLKIFKVRKKRNLRKKLIFHLLQNTTSDPSNIVLEAEHMYRYINGALRMKDFDEYFGAPESEEYVGENTPQPVEVPKEINGRNERAEKPFKPIHSL